MTQLNRRSEHCWEIPPWGAMRVPGVIYSSEELLEDLESGVLEQLSNVATLPGIVTGSFAMPDAHPGFGFPVGGVAAFDPEHGGVVSAGGVGFDISCGVRTLVCNLPASEVMAAQRQLADTLFKTIPSGVGSSGSIRLSADEMDAMLGGGARWAVERGWGVRDDLERIEEFGAMPGALLGEVSPQARKRQRNEMGTLGSGNHYLEVQRVSAIHSPEVAASFGLREGAAVVSIHCGSRGLGHQVCSEFSRRMAEAGEESGLDLPDRELAAARLDSKLGRAYLGAMAAAINCALANRQIITHLVREAFATVLPGATLSLLYDVSHNTCKLEEHLVDGRRKPLYVHRKGATRAYGPGHPELPPVLRAVGQPVLVGGTMGTASYILVGSGNPDGFSSACHGAGRRMSRTQAARQWQGREVLDQLYRERGIMVRTPSIKGVAEEAPGAYKDVEGVIAATAAAGLAAKVARLLPLICIKG